MRKYGIALTHLRTVQSANMEEVGGSEVGKAVLFNHPGSHISCSSADEAEQTDSPEAWQLPTAENAASLITTGWYKPGDIDWLSAFSPGSASVSSLDILFFSALLLHIGCKLTVLLNFVVGCTSTVSIAVVITWKLNDLTETRTHCALDQTMWNSWCRYNNG